MAEAAEARHGGWTALRSCAIRTVAKEGPWRQWPDSSPGRGKRAAERGFELQAARVGPTPPAWGGPQGDGDQADAGVREKALGLSGRVPKRVDEATKANLLDAVDAGGSSRGLATYVPRCIE